VTVASITEPKTSTLMPIIMPAAPIPKQTRPRATFSAVLIAASNSIMRSNNHRRMEAGEAVATTVAREGRGRQLSPPTRMRLPLAMSRPPGPAEGILRASTRTLRFGRRRTCNANVRFQGKADIEMRLSPVA